MTNDKSQFGQLVSYIFIFVIINGYRPNAISLQNNGVKDNVKGVKFNTDAISVEDHVHRCWHCAVIVSKVFIWHV